MHVFAERKSTRMFCTSLKLEYYILQSKKQRVDPMHGSSKGKVQAKCFVLVVAR